MRQGKLTMAALACCLTFHQTIIAQRSIPGRKILRNDSIVYRTFCKDYFIVAFHQPRLRDTVVTRSASREHPSMIKVQGNVRYDFLYRSLVDTPFSQRNFQQHTIQTNVLLTVKDKYPLRLTLSTRISNSPYFRNFFDPNLQFEQFGLQGNYKQKLLAKLQQQRASYPELLMAESALKEALENFNSLKSRLNDPDIFQKIVSDREALYNKQLRLSGLEEQVSEIDPGILKKMVLHRAANKLERVDSLRDSYTQFIERQRQELSIHQHRIVELQHKTDSIRTSLNKKLTAIQNAVHAARDLKELKVLAAKSGILDSSQSRFEKFASNVKGAGVGRSVVNYSELTAMNVALTGAHIEYNPNLYLAFAAGKVDYGFRDFFGTKRNQNRQHLVMGRIGFGDIEKKAVILSVLTGRKMTYLPLVNDSLNNTIPLAGYSLEAIVRKDANTSFNIEIAKSTSPVTGAFQDNKELANLFRFSDHRNMAISAKGQMLARQTDTRLSGFIRQSGRSFQSFSLFTYNSDQTAWLLKAEQPFLKSRLNVIGMLRRNDFINPFAQQTISTNTVFKSIQVIARFPKYPTMSVGYFPGSQLYIVDREKVRENVYYIANGSIIHQYKIWHIRMLSSLVYNKYESKGVDSGFINYNGVNYLVSHSLLWDVLQVQGGYSYNRQQEIQFSTMDYSVDYSVRKNLRFGVGFKYNRVRDGSTYIGGRAHLQINLPAIGGIQLQWDKSYLPTIYHSLFPVEIGRISWTKTF